MFTFVSSQNQKKRDYSAHKITAAILGVSLTTLLCIDDALSDLIILICCPCEQDLSQLNKKNQHSVFDNAEPKQLSILTEMRFFHILMIVIFFLSGYLDII